MEKWVDSIGRPAALRRRKTVTRKSDIVWKSGEEKTKKFCWRFGAGPTWDANQVRAMVKEKNNKKLSPGGDTPAVKH